MAKQGATVKRTQNFMSDALIVCAHGAHYRKNLQTGMWEGSCRNCDKNAVRFHKEMGF